MNALEHLKQELESISADDIENFGVTLAVGRAWYVRFRWLPRYEKPDTQPIHDMLDNKPELLLNLIKSTSFMEFITRLRSVDDWMRPRGYGVMVSGANMWTNLRLRLHSWTGGFS
ncbi:MAG: hypothetical protein WC965_02095 [Thiohalomonadaceae bacterium]